MIIIPAENKYAKRISYLIRKNAERVDENGYTPIQKKAWSDQNKPKAIIEQIKARKMFCAIQNNKLVGTIGIENNKVSGLYINYAKRGQGIGDKLLNHIERVAKQEKINELILTASPNGYGFYLKNGYESYGKIELNFRGVKFIETKMRKKLKY